MEKFKLTPGGGGTGTTPAAVSESGWPTPAEEGSGSATGGAGTMMIPKLNKKKVTLKREFPASASGGSEEQGQPPAGELGELAEDEELL